MGSMFCSISKSSCLYNYFWRGQTIAWQLGEPYWTRYKKSLKIPKGQSKSAYRRRTDNTMTKR